MGLVTEIKSSPGYTGAELHDHKVHHIGSGQPQHRDNRDSKGDSTQQFDSAGAVYQSSPEREADDASEKFDRYDQGVQNIGIVQFIDHINREECTANTGSKHDQGDIGDERAHMVLPGFDEEIQEAEPVIFELGNIIRTPYHHKKQKADQATQKGDRKDHDIPLPYPCIGGIQEVPHHIKGSYVSSGRDCLPQAEVPSHPFHRDQVSHPFVSNRHNQQGRDIADDPERDKNQRSNAGDKHRNQYEGEPGQGRHNGQDKHPPLQGIAGLNERRQLEHEQRKEEISDGTQQADISGRTSDGKNGRILVCQSGVLYRRRG